MARPDWLSRLEALPARLRATRGEGRNLDAVPFPHSRWHAFPPSGTCGRWRIVRSGEHAHVGLYSVFDVYLRGTTRVKVGYTTGYICHKKSVWESELEGECESVRV